MRTNHRFSTIEIVIVAAVLGIASVMTLPKFSKAAADERLNTLCETLQSVRAKITLYNIHHNGRWPRQATFIEQMSSITNSRGTTNPLDGEVMFGPYLDRIPVNPFTGGNAITGGDWLYDEETGRFVADDDGVTQGIRHKDL